MISSPNKTTSLYVSSSSTCTTPQAGSSTRTLLLTPQKRKRTTSIAVWQEEERTPRQKDLKGPDGNEGDTVEKEGMGVGDGCSLVDVYNWTFTKAATAPCFVRDVLDMRADSSEHWYSITSILVFISSVIGYEFFWLGRVPCRTVQVVGMVVAVDVYEGKVRLRGASVLVHISAIAFYNLPLSGRRDSSR